MGIGRKRKNKGKVVVVVVCFLKVLKRQLYFFNIFNLISIYSKLGI